MKYKFLLLFLLLVLIAGCNGSKEFEAIKSDIVAVNDMTTSYSAEFNSGHMTYNAIIDRSKEVALINWNYSMKPDPKIIYETTYNIDKKSYTSGSNYSHELVDYQIPSVDYNDAIIPPHVDSLRIITLLIKNSNAKLLEDNEDYYLFSLNIKNKKIRDFFLIYIVAGGFNNKYKTFKFSEIDDFFEGMPELPKAVESIVVKIDKDTKYVINVEVKQENVGLIIISFDDFNKETDIVLPDEYKDMQPRQY